MSLYGSPVRMHFNLSKNLRCFLKLSRCRYSTQEATKLDRTPKKISVPNRIDRSPTDILTALSGTVKTDYTAPHYKYHDDPFLIPMNNLQKRTYALSKEAGRKAAKFFLDNYPDLFYRDDAEPKIAAFSYKDKIAAETKVDEQDLINCIGANQMLNAITVYKNCLDQKIEVSKETTQSLLEMACYYNSKDGPESEFLEELWFKRSERSVRRTWDELGFAEELFASIGDKDSKSFCAMIQGAAKFNHAERAYNLYREMLEKGFGGTTETFNLLIRCTPYLRESNETRWELVREFLNEMKCQGVKPDTNTFNEVLDVFSRGRGWSKAPPNALQVMKEMKVLGLKPSLATYYLLLNIFMAPQGPTSPILYEIMAEITRQGSFVMTHPKDVMFFVQAMDVCNRNLNDLDLAYKIHDFLQQGDNHKLMGDSFNESVYYQNFFKLLATCETVEVMMDIYDKYVPNIYTPEPSVMGQIVGAIDLYDAHQYIPQLWTDIVTFEHYTRDQVVHPLLAAMAKAPKSDLQVKLIDVTSDLVKRIDELVKNERTSMVSRPINWSGDMLSDCITIFLTGGELDKAAAILRKLDQDQQQIMGFMRTAVLQDFASAAIQASDYDKLNLVIKYTSEIGNSEVLKFCKSSLDKIEDESARKTFDERLTDLLTLTGINGDSEEVPSTNNVGKETE
ncbi:Protein PTCD3 -like protein, mitochondrial [Halotydeus destructor]|nr:Protein PTCD3 -like protein, mitochondrial [Halotydeus destructor]